MILCLPMFSHGQFDTEYKNFAPTISPDERYVTWYGKVNGNWDLYNYNLEKREVSQLTKTPSYEGEPSWAPDGHSIVLTSNKDGTDQLFLISLRTGEIEQITQGGNEKDYPTFSPDGNSIFYRELEGKDWHLFQMDLNSRKSERISKISMEGRFRVSTEGRSISFVTKEQKKHPIVRIDLEGYLLSKTETPFEYPGNPHFSDQLGLFLFDAHSEGKEESGDGKWELYTIDPKGKNLVQLTDNTLDDWGGYWSPDSKEFVYSGGGLNNTGYEIFLKDLKSDKLIQLSSRN